MITGPELYKLAKSRFDEAQILLNEHRPDGAVYLCGYALELILKRSIVAMLEWDGYPETEKEFKNYRSFKVHDLDVLLRLSGLEKKIQSDNTVYAKWQIAHTWNSEIRYKKIGTTSEIEAGDTLDATRVIVNFILNILRTR
jgi:hypothetical protein